MNPRFLLIVLLGMVFWLAACAPPELSPPDSPGIFPPETPGADEAEPSETESEPPALDMTPTESPTEPPVDEDGSQPLPTNLQPIPLPTKDLNMPPPISPGTPPAAMSGMVDQATADLAKRLSISADLISVMLAREVVWSDSSLGCPQPGLMYLMVLSPGYQIVLGADGKEYHYHAGHDAEVFYCANPSPPTSSGSVDASQRLP